MAETKKPKGQKPVAVQTSSKPKTQKEQSERFIATARELGCDEDGAKLDAALAQISKYRPPD